MNHIDRIKAELADLVLKGTKLDEALMTLDLSPEERGLMYAQLHIMNAYAEILEERIALAERK